MKGARHATWPLLLIALPASIAIWGGWTSLGQMCGFGYVDLLPGIWSGARLDLAVTLPVGLEAYATYAIGAWLRPGTPDSARRFAMWSSFGALTLGMAGQVSYHLLAAWHVTTAPWPVITAVACMPVTVVGCAAALTHMLRAHSRQASPAGTTAPGAAGIIAAAVAERIAGHAAQPLAVPLAVPVAGPSPAPIETAPPTPVADTAPSPPPAPVASAEAARPAIPPARQPASAIRAVKRKGAGKCPDEMVTQAIREMAAEGGGDLPTKYKVTKELGMGDTRAQRLLDEIRASMPTPLSAARSARG